MEIVKGSSGQIQFTAYTYWSGDTASSSPANLTGSTIKLLAKINDTDLDAAAVMNLTGANVDAVNGVGKVDIAATDTNSISYKDLVYEIVVKLADGTYIRSGCQPLKILPHVIKTLP